MMKDLFRDSFMILVLIVVMLTPFFPVLLKGICPKCKKRKLESLETVQSEDEREYVTFYRCHNCQAQYKRLRSGPFEQTNVDEKELVAAR